MSATIHWLGVGLSSTPGIKYLASSEHKLIVWNRTLGKAQKLLSENNINCDLNELRWRNLHSQINAGDIVVSMLPATQHKEVANLCLDKNAHFVSSSYISPEMRELQSLAAKKGLVFLNEIGLDPGIDHLFAHLLVDAYTGSEHDSNDTHVYFRSYCGGVPYIPNDFKYKFSWSPLGVLKALKSPAQWISHGQVNNSVGPWEAIKEINIESINEVFEAYPNRDSIPFIQQYQFNPNWHIEEFVRGTLRLKGWSTAWQYLFDKVADIDQNNQAELEQISQRLEQEYSYANNEADRVVMSVELEARKNNLTVWHQRYVIDEPGNDEGQAMARLVSIPVALGVETVIQGNLKPGVHAAPSDPKVILKWLNKLSHLGMAYQHETIC